MKLSREVHQTFPSAMGEPLDLAGLTILQKIFLTTDGTLTKLLEVCLSEPMQLVKLSEKIISLEADLLPLEVEAGHSVIDRKILLQGEKSRHNWLYATSIIVPDRLTEPLRTELMSSTQTLGNLWLIYKLETFKEQVALIREPAAELAGYFQISRTDSLLSRVYRVFSNRTPIMLITEKFPESYFV